MSRRITLIAAVAATALTASPALARPVDDGTYARAKGPTSSLAGTVSPSQDLRGERAKDTTAIVAAPHQDLRGERARDAVAAGDATFARDPWPTPGARSIHPYEPAATTASRPTGDGDDDVWLILGLAAAATAAGAAGLVRRHRRVAV